MAGPTPEDLRRTVADFPEPPDAAAVARIDDLLDGTYSAMVERWHPELERLTTDYAEDKVLRERVLEHVESVPSLRLSDGAAPLHDRREDLQRAAEARPEVAAVSAWYNDLRGLLTDRPSELTPLERVLHSFGYVLAHGLFLGATSPATVVRRLRLAYRSVGVRIDNTEAETGAERTTFTCPYRNVAAGQCGKRWVCHEKLDRVDDGYVTYLRERGIDYQRPRGCPGSEQCFSTVARAGPEQWWPKTPPEALAGDP
ncbi:MAG: hypothetical protein ABEI27_07145 [Halobellus sp.]|uniref:hypothetical protein n=1 Tax=Halobellus sp. TaxID=1979212 RepID=UPI0035D3D937